MGPREADAFCSHSLTRNCTGDEVDRRLKATKLIVKFMQGYDYMQWSSGMTVNDGSI